MEGSVWEWALPAVVGPLVAAGVIGYIKLAMASLRVGIETVGKDVRKSTDRIEAGMSKMEDQLEILHRRLMMVELEQAERKGRETAMIAAHEAQRRDN